MSIGAIPCSNPSKCPTKSKTHTSMAELRKCSGATPAQGPRSGLLITLPPGFTPPTEAYAPERGSREAWERSVGRFHNGIETYPARTGAQQSVADTAGGLVFEPAYEIDGGYVRKAERTFGAGVHLIIETIYDVKAGSGFEVESQTSFIACSDLEDPIGSTIAEDSVSHAVASYDSYDRAMAAAKALIDSDEQMSEDTGCGDYVFDAIEASLDHEMAA